MAVVEAAVSLKFVYVTVLLQQVIRNISNNNTKRRPCVTHTRPVVAPGLPSDLRRAVLVFPVRFASALFKNYPIVFFPFRYNTGASATRETLLWLLRALGADTWASVVAGAVASFWTSLLPAGTARESACAKRNMELVIYLPLFWCSPPLPTAL